MKIIIACECSGIVRDAFIANGHDAISCDLKPTERPGPHIIAKGDEHLQEILYGGGWDGMVAHPECKRLCNSGWWYVLRYGLQDEVRAAAAFFNMIWNAPIPAKALENSQPNKLALTLIPMYSQAIQPYNFGEDASKRTCLWVQGWPLLRDTLYYPPRIVNGKKRWGNQTNGGWNRLSPGPARSADRARTYPGIAQAMADQWGGLLK